MGSYDQPRFFTLFGVKFINMLDGVFFHRGKQFKMGADGEYALDKEFAYDEFEEGQTANITTLLRHRSTYDRMGEWQDGSKYQTILDFLKRNTGRESSKFLLRKVPATVCSVRENTMTLPHSLQKNTAPGWWIRKAEKKHLT